MAHKPTVFTITDNNNINFSLSRKKMSFAQAFKNFRDHIPLEPFHPVSFDLIGHYNARSLSRDISSGLTVGMVALPLAMAFAIASGVTPEAGIYTSIIAGFLIAIRLSSSNRRSCRRFYRDYLRHHRQLRFGQPHDCHYRQWHTALSHGVAKNRQLYTFYSYFHCDRFHKRYRCAHCLITGERLFRPEH